MRHPRKARDHHAERRPVSKENSRRMGRVGMSLGGFVGAGEFWVFRARVGLAAFVLYFRIVAAG